MKDYNIRVECCNALCGWIGKLSQCVYQKHDNQPLCPECHEVVEEVDKG